MASTTGCSLVHGARAIRLHPYALRWQSLASALALLSATACGPVDGPRGSDAIVLESVAILGASDGPGAFTSFPIPHKLAQSGEFVVADQGGLKSVLVYDSVGHFLRTVGNEGEGPGEFRGVELAVGVLGDSLLVIDAALQRASIFGPDRNYVRGFPLGMPVYDLVESSAGHLVVVPGGPEGFPRFVVMDMDGRTVASISDSSVSPTRQFPSRIARSRPGAFWSVPQMLDYHLELWSDSGVRVRELRPRSAELTDDEALKSVSPDVAPQWSIQGMWEDAQGHVVVMANVADPQWSQGLGAPRQGEGGRVSYRIEDRDRVYDTYIEVIDPTTGEVLSSARFDPAFRIVASAGIIGRLTEADDGTLRVELSAVRFKAQ